MNGSLEKRTFKEILINSAENDTRSFPIVAFGSSIVEVYQGCGGYHNWIDLIGNTVRFSYGKNIVFVNQGIGGNTVVDLNARVHRDVIAYDPAATIIAIGGNCAKLPIELDTWIAEFRKLIGTIKSNGIHPVVCTYFYQDFDQLPSHFSIYRKYRDFLSITSDELGFEFIDLFHYFEILSMRTPNYTKEILRNPLHVNHIGNALMSYVFCKLTGIPIPEFAEQIDCKVDEYARIIGI